MAPVDNKVIRFYTGGARQELRVLLNDNDIEAMTLLTKKWEELYGLKMDWIY